MRLTHGISRPRPNSRFMKGFVAGVVRVPLLCPAVPEPPYE